MLLHGFSKFVIAQRYYQLFMVRLDLSLERLEAYYQ